MRGPCGWWVWTSENKVARRQWSGDRGLACAGHSATLVARAGALIRASTAVKALIPGTVAVDTSDISSVRHPTVARCEIRSESLALFGSKDQPDTHIDETLGFSALIGIGHPLRVGARRPDQRPVHDLRHTRGTTSATS